ncbi:MAG: TolC family protein [Planctomycetota bacterium]
MSMPACRSPGGHRREADDVVTKIVEDTQRRVLDRTEAFTIERPADTLRRRLMLDQNLPHAAPSSLSTRDITPIEQWPDDDYLTNTTDRDGSTTQQSGDPGNLTLVNALQIGALNSREYQAQKERVFQTALSLDLERDAFRSTWTGVLDSMFSSDPGTEVVIDDEGNTDQQTINGVEHGGVLGLSQRLKNGMSFTGLIGLDLVSLLTRSRLYSRGVFADVTITLPLMRGSGRFVVTEPLTQAERNVVYAIYEFERFKRSFAVEVATDYLAVLQLLDQIDNAEENYRGLVVSTRRAARLAQAGELPEIQVDQSRQDELRARSRWVSAREAFGRRLDAYKVALGLPADCDIELDRDELDRLTVSPAAQPVEKNTEQSPAEVPDADAPVTLVEPSREGAGPLEMDPGDAVRLALANRLDLRVEIGRVFDAQRTVAVAADQLRADLTLLGTGSVGERRTLASAGLLDSRPNLDEGAYSTLLTLDLPLERTAERNIYRNSLINLEQAVRDVQALEDEIKLEVRNDLRSLLESREGLQIQAEAVAVARKRVESTNLFLEAGRVEIRDVLEAQEALISARNALTAARVNYRVGELNLQRDLELLEVDEKGLWREYSPDPEGK